MNADRLFQTLNELSLCNETPGKGVTRFSWTETARMAQHVLERELEQIGLTPWYDAAGNLHAVFEGQGVDAPEIPRVMTGSHLDTVRQGGRLDGTFGVVAALEALRTFAEEGARFRSGIEFVAFAEEEGSNFGCTCLGSKILAGLCSVEDLHHISRNGESVYKRLVSYGLDPDSLEHHIVSPTRTKAFLEVHIEQNAILEQSGCSLGVVRAICGMRLHRITLRGKSDHAASPMQGRKDPMAGFAEIAFRLEEICQSHPFPAGFCCTVGEIACMPNVGIVIPETVLFTIDIRHVDVSALENGWKRIEQLVREVAERRGLDCDIVPVSASGGTKMSEDLVATLAKAAQARGIQPIFMESGPAHDAASMGQRIPAGLLFVPSKAGLSHCPEENTSPEDLALGAVILEDALRQVAGQIFPQE